MKKRRIWNLADWPVARRLFAVIVAALLMGVVFGGLRVDDTENSANQFSKTLQLAKLSQQLIGVSQDLENEEDATDVALITGIQGNLQALQAQTNNDLVPVRASLQQVLNGGFNATIVSDASTVNNALSESNVTGTLHALFNTAEADGDVVVPDYEAVLADIATLQSEVSLGITDQSLDNDVQTLSSLAQAKDLTSEELTTLDQALSNPAAPNNVLPVGTLPFASETSLNLFYDEERSAESAFFSTATEAEQGEFVDLLGPQADKLDGETESDDIVTALFSVPGGGALDINKNGQTPQEDQNGIVLQPFINDQLNGTANNPGVLNFGASIAGNDTVTNAAGQTVPAKGEAQAQAAAQAVQQAEAVTDLPSLKVRWDTGTSAKLGALETTEQFVAGNIVTRATQLQQAAQQSALLFAGITIAVLLVVLGGALLVARSLVRPLARLRVGALDIASVQLPERVRLLSDDPESAEGMTVAPIDVTTQDEIGQVARAFDQVHSEAIRLAGEQALLRSNFNAMFVNLSRRSQTLIERLARQIDTLEQTEDDPDRLGSLFSMDHLVTRMRRNSENLLLLAGHENPRKRAEAAPIADIARAAVSEIEQYNRVTLNIPPGVSVIGQAVSDVVHLLAELIENATIFSPKDTQVQISMQELTSGGVLIEILDKGIGVSEARLTDMNWRLDNPPTIDVGVSRHMGLFAVARLAERHRVRVRLRPAPPQGLSALVWLPDSVIERTRGLAGAMTGAYAAQAAAPQAQARVGIGNTTPLPAASSAVGLATDDYVGGNGFGNGNGGGFDAGGFGAGNGFGAGSTGNNLGSGRGNGNGRGNGSALGNGGANGLANGNGRSTGTGNGVAETRTATGWFRGGKDAPAELSGPPSTLGGRGDFITRETPISGDTTASGLPMRTPRANMPPGMSTTEPPAASAPASRGNNGLPTRTAGASGRGTGSPMGNEDSSGSSGGSGAELPTRSPEQVRSRLSGFQRGMRRAESQGDSGGHTPTGGEGTDR